MRSTGRLRIVVAWLGIVGLCGFFEMRRLQAAIESAAGPLGWFANWDPETTLPFVILLLLPLLCIINGTGHRPPQQAESGPATNLRLLPCGVIFLLSLTCSAIIGYQPIATNGGPDDGFTAFADLPPAYHDEYSYLLQAQTFAAGRLSWPPAPIRPDLFHQYHVLNEQRTASRYFPWTGAWIALFLQTGRPVTGHWLAGALAAVFFYLSALHMLRPRAAFCAGLLIALSPGLAVFSNLLLAHHPTLLALSIFLWAMLHVVRQPTIGWTLLAGCCLTLAMLGRPMTAAAFGLPWGMVFGWQWLRSTDPRWTQRRWRLLASMGLPLIFGFAILGALNQSITGSVTRSSYQQYTDIYTPRHTFGFNNGVRGDARQTEKVLHSYDQWAENLTGPLAVRNLGRRCLASAQWSLGLIPIVLGLTLVLMQLANPADSTNTRIQGLRLVLASILTLHIAHIPYWFDGIMHWHYVFETAPLLLILVAAGLSSGLQSLSNWLPVRWGQTWIVLLTVATLLPGWFSVDSVWGRSKVASATSELAWSRRQFALFLELTSADGIDHPALVLVDESASDPQLSFIINRPDYDADVLVARKPPTPVEISELQAAFPDRTLYTFDPARFQLQRSTIP